MSKPSYNLIPTSLYYVQCMVKRNGEIIKTYIRPTYVKDEQSACEEAMAYTQQSSIYDRLYFTVVGQRIF